MKAKVIKPFPGCPDGSTRTRTFEKGDEVTGSLAEVAVKEGWAEEVQAKKPAAAKAEGGKAAKAKEPQADTAKK